LPARPWHQFSFYEPLPHWYLCTIFKIQCHTASKDHKRQTSQNEMNSGSKAGGKKYDACSFYVNCNWRYSHRHHKDLLAEK
jgi:hypothetical protein